MFYISAQFHPTSSILNPGYPASYTLHKSSTILHPNSYINILSNPILSYPILSNPLLSIKNIYDYISRNQYTMLWDQR